jgi:hypothetical protein
MKKVLFALVVLTWIMLFYTSLGTTPDWIIYQSDAYKWGVNYTDHLPFKLGCSVVVISYVIYSLINKTK